MFAPPHPVSVILHVHLKTGVIAEYNILSLGILDSEVGPGPVKASISVIVGEQGFQTSLLARRPAWISVAFTIVW
jgi:hypothetical protein